MQQGVFIDTNIPMYAAGTAHPYRQPAQRIIAAIASGQLVALTDSEVFQEILYRYFSIGQRAQGLLIFDNFRQVMAGQILPVEDVDVQQARLFADRYSSLQPRDLIHLAIVVRHKVAEIVTTDHDFDNIVEARRVDPIALAAQL